MPQDVLREPFVDTLQEWTLPKGEGIDARWLQALVAVRFADLLAQLTTGQRLQALSVEDRCWLREQVTQLVEDAVERFEDEL